MKRTAIFSIGLALIGGILFAPAKAAPNVACNLGAGDYIVTLSKGAVVSSEVKNVRGRQIVPNYIYDEALNGFAATLSAEEACELRANPRVKNIELDQIIKADAIMNQSSNVSWGIDRIDQISSTNGTYVYDDVNRGLGVTAYVIDTGIYTSDKDFGGRARTGYDAISRTPQMDCNGHGTHVAGTIGGNTYGVAKAVSLVAVRVLNCQGSGTNSGVIAGINWVIKDHQAGVKAVANMSLGGGASATLDDAVRKMIADGVVTAVAAGNSAVNANTSSPARVAEAITVGATDSTDSLAYFSNYGAIVDINAPGVSITSDWLKDGVKTISGTSMATPHVTGALALALNRGITFTLGQIPSELVNPSSNAILSANAISAGTTAKLLYKSTW